MPVAIGPLDSSLDGLTEALLTQLDFEFPGSEIVSVIPLEHGVAPGYSIDARRTVDGLDYRYRMRVLRTAERGYLLAAWRLASSPGDVALLDEVLDGVTVDPAHPAELETIPRALARPGQHRRPRAR